MILGRRPNNGPETGNSKQNTGINEYNSVNNGYKRRNNTEMTIK